MYWWNKPKPNKEKKLFELDQLELGNPIEIIKFDIIKVIPKTENKIESKLKIAKDSLSKIILLLLFLSCLRIIYSRAINLSNFYIYLYP